MKQRKQTMAKKAQTGKKHQLLKKLFRSKEAHLVTVYGITVPITVHYDWNTQDYYFGYDDEDIKAQTVTGTKSEVEEYERLLDTALTNFFQLSEIQNVNVKGA
jgi:K+/H+ antiporter YhaU regulatory subunit KhtT